VLKLESLLTFVATAEAGSISEAARRLQISKSVASERLAELERNIGATLMRRSTRKLMLTEDGIAFLERAKRIVREVTEATAEVSERRGRAAENLCARELRNTALERGTEWISQAESAHRIVTGSGRPFRRCRGRL
jgi:DNA-binding transcriptional LysR family regulator